MVYYVIEKLSLTCILHYQINIVSILVYFVELDDIRMAEYFQDLYFSSDSV